MSTAITPIPPPFFSPYLDDQCNKITSKPVPWEVNLPFIPPSLQLADESRATNAQNSFQQMNSLS